MSTEPKHTPCHRWTAEPLVRLLIVVRRVLRRTHARNNNETRGGALTSGHFCQLYLWSGSKLRNGIEDCLKPQKRDDSDAECSPDRTNAMSL